MTTVVVKIPPPQATTMLMRFFMVFSFFEACYLVEDDNPAAQAFGEYCEQFLVGFGSFQLG